jgi:hypothetical protein
MSMQELYTAALPEATPTQEALVPVALLAGVAKPEKPVPRGWVDDHDRTLLIL